MKITTTQREIQSKISNRFYTLLAMKLMICIMPLLQIGFVCLFFTDYIPHIFLVTFIIVILCWFLQFISFTTKYAIEYLDFKKPEFVSKTTIKGQDVIAVYYNEYYYDGQLKWYISKQELEKFPDTGILRTMLLGNYIALDLKKHKQEMLDKLC